MPRFCFSVLFALAWVAPGVEALALSPPVRPNILWVVSEDNAWNYAGPYGDPLARTPNIDRLAARGVTFDRAYCPSPVCAPTRSSIITGRHAVAMGTQHMRSERPLPEGVRFFPEFLRDAGYFCTNNNKTDYNTSTPFGPAWNENGSKAHWRHRAPGQPFFAVFNFAQSHESQLHARKPLITDPARVRVPAYLPDTPEIRADLAQYYDNVSRADEALGAVLAQLDEDGLTGSTVVFYYSDNGGAVSRSKRFLYQNGTRTALVVSFPHDLSALAPGAAGTHNAEIVSYVDLAPTVLSIAGLPLPAQFLGRPFAGLQRRPAPAFTLLFRDRMDERYDLARAVTDGRFRYIRNYYPDQPWGQNLNYLWKQSSMREWEKLYRAGSLNSTQRSFFERKPAEELYDDVADPDNVVNLAGDPMRMAEVLAYRKMLQGELLRLRDAGFMPEPMLIEMAGGRPVTTVTADAAQYPLEQILEFLDRAQLDMRSAFSPGGEAEYALRSRHPVLRYWAAVCAQSAPSLPADFSRLLTHRQPEVRVAAAEAILRRGSSEAAWQALEGALDEPRILERRVFALNAMFRIPDPLPARVRARVETLSRPPEKNSTGEDYVARASATLLERKTKSER